MTAKAVAAEWEKSGSWNGEVVVPEPLPEPTQPHRVTVERAVTAFLLELNETAAFATHKKYRLLLIKFKEFSIVRGYVMIDQWEPTDVRDFRTSWAINPQTGARRMAMLKPFFEYCLANEWITRNPARLVKNPRGRDAGEKRAEQKLPFTGEKGRDVQDMVAEALNLLFAKYRKAEIAPRKLHK
jgi:site-specific recombinase XerC